MLNLTPPFICKYTNNIPVTFCLDFNWLAPFCKQICSSGVLFTAICTCCMLLYVWVGFVIEGLQITTLIPILLSDDTVWESDLPLFI